LARIVGHQATGDPGCGRYRVWGQGGRRGRTARTGLADRTAWIWPPSASRSPARP